MILGLVGFPGCSASQRQGTGSSYVIVSTLEGASGAKPDDKSNTFSSDVVTNVKQQVNGQEVRVPTVYEDAAIVPGAASAKGVDGAVAGRANILVFPGIDACNIGYKIAEHIGGAWTAPVTQGFTRSYHDVSRGAALPDLVGTCVMAALMGSVAIETARTA